MRDPRQPEFSDTMSEETSRLKLVLYTRDDCCLCDRAKARLERLARRFPIDVVERDVDADSTWRESYGDDVPVGVLEGRKVFKHRVDPAALERAIRARL